MNNRSFTISIMVALLAVLMVHSYVTSTEETYKRRFGKKVAVVVAKKNIEEFEMLDQTNLELKEIPEEFASPGSTPDIKSVSGGLARAPILKGEQISQSKVTILGSKTGLSRQVSIGKRAITIRVSTTSGVAGLIKPGDRVDVITVVDYGKGSIDFKEVATVLQDVLVLATGKLVVNSVPAIVETSPYKRQKKSIVNLSEFTTYNTVTLEVDPRDAQRIVLIDNELKGVHLSLRNNDDSTQEKVNSVTVSDILGKDSKRYRQIQEIEKQRRIGSKK